MFLVYSIWVMHMLLPKPDTKHTFVAVREHLSEYNIIYFMKYSAGKKRTFSPLLSSIGAVNLAEKGSLP